LPVVLLHGLTAPRRYAVMGSRTLERSGHRVIAFDARGHGQSAPATTPDTGQAPHDELLAQRAVAGILGIRTQRTYNQPRWNGQLADVVAAAPGSTRSSLRW